MNALSPARARLPIRLGNRASPAVQPARTGRLSRVLVRPTARRVGAGGGASRRRRGDCTRSLHASQRPWTALLSEEAYLWAGRHRTCGQLQLDETGRAPPAPALKGWADRPTTERPQHVRPRRDRLVLSRRFEKGHYRL